MFKLTFFGGVSEIGGNKILLDFKENKILLDFGISYEKIGNFFDEFLQPRANAILEDLIYLKLLPPLPGIYREDLLNTQFKNSSFRKILLSYKDYLNLNKKNPLNGVLISHAHADHFQYIAFLDPEIPIICSPTTKTILKIVEEISPSLILNEVYSFKERFINYTSDKSIFPEQPAIKTSKKIKRKFITLNNYEEFIIGSLKIQAIPVDHSIPGALAFLIAGQDGKKIFYSGDFRFHGRSSQYSNTLKELVKDLNPEALIIEGTRIKEETKDDEEKVKEVILKLVNSSSGLVLVDFGWKDITRFETIEEVARKTKRTLVISPKLAYLLYNLKINLNSNVKVYLKRRDSLLYSLSDYLDDKYLLGYLLDWGEKSSLMKQAFESQYEEFLKPALAHFYEGIKAFHIKENPQKYILMLNFFELNELFDLKPKEGSIYIKASSEPFNDEMKIDQKKLKNWLKYFKIKAYLEKDLYGIHASGHASSLDLKEFIKLMKPKIIFPIHTLYPELFENLAPQVIKTELNKVYQI